MTIIKLSNDINHIINDFRYSCLHMIFSKTLGYALRVVLYVSMVSKENNRVQLEEIARELSIPRHFLGKVMVKIARKGVLNSTKGPFGGFSMNDRTLKTSLYELMEIIGETHEFGSCVLRLRECNSKNPCPVHNQIDAMRKKWHEFLSSTTIDDLLNKKQPDFIKSITAI